MMIKRSWLFLLSVILLPVIMEAQEKVLTLSDLIPGGKTYNRFVPRDLKQLSWCGDEYFYVRGDSVIGGEPGKKSRLLFALADLNQALTAAGLKEAASLPSFSVPYEDRPVLAFVRNKRRLHFDFRKREIIANYPWDRGSNHDFCAATGRVAFTEANNLFILSPDGTVVPVTRETNEGIVCGQAVHQREFGISKGTFWAPDGSALAFYRMDESMVTPYPLVNIDARCATAEPFRYPMAGMKSHEVTVGVYNVETATTVWLKTGLPKEKYLTNIAWSPNGKSLYVAELNREQNEMHLVRYSALTGEKEAELFSETDLRYVEPQHPVQFLPNDTTRFIWQSERDGFNHLYLYDTNGRLVRQLTGGEWVVTDVLDALRRYVWSVDLESDRLMDCLSWKAGVHHWKLSSSGAYAIDKWSSPTVPREIDLVRVKDAKVVETLLTAPDPYKNYRMPKIEVGKILAADGKTPLNYRLVLPPDLDPSKKYPTVVYVYGGPHAQMVTGDWLNGTRGWDIYMALRGYVIFTVDNRGSANRGHAFESIIHRNLGQNEMADQMKGVEFLKSLPYVDADRIGVHGWSFGGFMTTNLMLTYPDVFKVGVAGGPVIDWSNYEIMYGERYMDRPQDNPEGYPDYFVYPRHQHNVIGKDRPHLHEKITRYFDDYLK